MEEVRKRGRPRKDPNKTEKEPYHIKPYEGKGRPPKNPHPNWGGPREGSGRPKKLRSDAQYPCTIAFRCSAITKERFRLLKERDIDVNRKLERAISTLASAILGGDNPIE